MQGFEGFLSTKDTRRSRNIKIASKHEYLFSLSSASSDVVRLDFPQKILFFSRHLKLPISDLVESSSRLYDCMMMWGLIVWVLQDADIAICVLFCVHQDALSSSL
jgi:hypothetical protein